MNPISFAKLAINLVESLVERDKSTTCSLLVVILDVSLIFSYEA